MSNTGYKERPTKCNICSHQPLEYGRMEDFGLTPYQSGFCYYCRNCGNFIVTHKNDRKKAIGIIADQETKELRAACHEKMDALWSSSRGRRYCYRKLAQGLGIDYDDCHFGHMDKEMLRKALELIDTIPRKDFL